MRRITFYETLRMNVSEKSHLRNTYIEILFIGNIYCNVSILQIYHSQAKMNI